MIKSTNRQVMTVTEATEQSIQQFLQSYWRWPVPDYSRSIGLQALENISALTEKYGEEVREQWETLFHRLLELDLQGKSEDARRVHSQLFDLDYQTGSCDDDIFANGRTRMNLELVLRFLSEQQEEDFTLLDIGCGDGKITLALAQYFPHLQKVYAVDQLRSACGRLMVNSISLPEAARQKVVHLHGDYTSVDMQDEINSLCPGGVDYALALYAVDHEHHGELRFPFPEAPALETIRKLTKPGGTVIFGAHAYVPPIENAPSPSLYQRAVEDAFEEASEEVAQTTGFNFMLYDWTPSILGECSLLSTATVPH